MTVVLLSAPWSWPYTPSLALATLQPILEANGFEVATLHGMLFYPRTGMEESLWDFVSPYLFVPSAFPATPLERTLEVIDRTIRKKGFHRSLDDKPKEGIAFGAPVDSLRPQIAQELEYAALCIDRIVEAVLEKNPAVVAMSAMFQGQLPGVIAITRKLKQRRPGLRIMLGGAACFGDQAIGLCSSFPELDVVCNSEGESVVVPLTRALIDGTDLGNVLGIVYRDRDGVVRNTGHANLVRDLDELPVPDFRPFFAQLEKSEWHHPHLQLRVFFEMSRGCWWGDKHLCSFCGLNPAPIGYRKKSPERAYQEIVEILDRHPQAALLHAADNILDMGYFQTLLPRLKPLARRREHPLRLFVEVKSNLRRPQMQVLAEAGAANVQPGIESFNDGVLDVMRKGCTGLQQVRCIKWGTELGFRLEFNILLANPGDKAEFYEEMAELLPYLEHLHPPAGCINMELSRFSPYFDHPEEWGITNIRPHAIYRDIYLDSSVDVAKIAYNFEYDHPIHTDEPLLAARRKVVAASLKWMKEWTPQSLTFRDIDGQVLIAETRGPQRKHRVLSGQAPALWRYLDDDHTHDGIARRFPALDTDVVNAALDTWQHQRWLCRSGNRVVITVPRYAAEKAVHAGAARQVEAAAAHP